MFFAVVTALICLFVSCSRSKYSNNGINQALQTRKMKLERKKLTQIQRGITRHSKRGKTWAKREKEERKTWKRRGGKRRKLTRCHRKKNGFLKNTDQLGKRTKIHKF